MQSDKLQHMVVLLEEEARASGFEYSADFLKIAASSLSTEIALSGDKKTSSESLLESPAAMH